MPDGACSIDGCDRPKRSRGWCYRHYRRWYDTGSPFTPSNRGHTVEHRLRSRLTVTAEGCWVFSGGSKGGTHPYGQLKVDGRMVTTHRLAYELWVGPIPAGYFVCHRCDNPPCCNPDHLFLGTQHDNMGDMSAKGRANGVGLLKAREGLGPKLRVQAAERRAQAARAAGFPDDWKRCPGCGTWKDRTGYSICRKEGDGLQSYCRPCMHSRVKAWREKHAKRSK